MIDGLDSKEFLAGFLAESEDHLAQSGTNLLAAEKALQQGQLSPRAVRELFRSLHTIKGLAAMIGIDPIVDVAHAMETVLRTADRAGGRLSAPGIDLLHKGLRAIEERTSALSKGSPVRPAPFSLLEGLQALEPAPAGVGGIVKVPLNLDPELLGKLSAADREELSAGAARGRRALHVEFIPSHARAERGITISSVRERMANIADIVKVLPRAVTESISAPGALVFALLIVTDASNAAVAEIVDGSPDDVVSVVGPEAAAAALLPLPGIDPDDQEDHQAFDGGSPRRGMVRVEVSRLDEALERLSALIVSRFRLGRAVQELAGRGVDTRALSEIVQENARLLRDLRASIMRARMVSVTELLERVPLIVRGASRAVGKSVKLEIDAGKAELDKAVADRIFPTIVHLVRNAVDHAIEPPEDRKRLGKPPAGLVRVTGFERSSNQLELVVSDDGAGIDAVKVARAAGRSVPENDAQLLELISLPGVSTREHATQTSGRGLGMDIVRRITVDQLGGEIQLKTTPGQGTAITLRIPLTITILDAFSFMSGARPFVVPVGTVEEIIEVDSARLIRGPGQDRKISFFERRGETVPLVKLATLFELDGAPLTRTKAMIVRRNGEPFAFEVDRMVGQQEVVVRPLEDPLVRVVGVTGSTDLGDGKPTLVLDLIALSGSLLNSGRSEVLA